MMKSIGCLALMLSVITLTMSGCTPYHAQGITAGALVGGVTGALVDHREPARGALIGGTLGGIVGGTMAEMSYRNARDQYSYRDQYYDNDGRRGYRSEPYNYSYPRYM
jgi:predicted membrane protein